MPLGRRRHAPQIAPQVTTNVQSESFSPPLAMQQSVWDSITNGNFIDAKIYAYSRRSLQEPGRVHTPKALFVNTHVLAAACDYFRSTFELSDGIETTLGAGPPPGVDATFDLEDHDLDSDYDSFEEAPYETATQAFPDKIVKAYVVKYTAYRTLRAIIWYIYSGEIVFFPDSSSGCPCASVKSIYRFAHEHEIGNLKALAFTVIATSLNQLEQSRLIAEVFTPFASRYPELRDLYIQRLRTFLAFGPNEAFRQQLFRYFSGDLPHSRDLFTSLLQVLMDRSTANGPNEVNNSRSSIQRVSRPWPTRTRKALFTSLDSGEFESVHVVIPLGPELTGQPIYFAGAVDEQVGSSISRGYQPGSTSQNNTRISLATWQAIAYYMYADCITFEPLGSQSIALAPAHSPSDAQFHGYPCSPREVVSLARKLATCNTLIDLAANEIVSRMTPANVVEEMFYDSPVPRNIIDRGVEIIQANRENAHIRSQLQGMLEEAASGSIPANADAFFACFTELLRQNPSS